MIKKITTIIIATCMILFGLNIVNAATENVSLNVSSKSVKPGGTFTVTLSAKCDDGINGIDTTYSYDEDKLELVSAKVADDNWVNLGEDDAIQVICNTTSKITDSDIYILTFKVKDNAKTGTAKVSTSEIKVDSDVSESSFEEKAKTVTVNITADNSNGQNQGSDDNNDENQGSGSQNNNGSGTNNGSTVSDLLKDEEKGAKKEPDVSNKIIPKTGINDIMPIMITSIVIAISCSVILFIKIRKINKQ